MNVLCVVFVGFGLFDALNLKQTYTIKTKTNSDIAFTSQLIGVISINILVFIGLCLILEITARLAIFIMIITNTIHPPAGANPIIVILTGQGISFVLFPVAVGALMLVLFAYLYNKLLKRNYP
mgnify:CR=1 FL=1